MMTFRSALYFPKAMMFISILLNNNISAKQLPSYIRTCSRSHPDLNGCVIRLLTKLRSNLIVGIKELNIPPIDPFNLKGPIEWSQGTDRTALKAKFDNVTITGLRDYVVTNALITSHVAYMRLHFYVPNLEVSSIFKMNGHIFMLPVRGVGFFNGLFGDFFMTKGLNKAARNTKTKMMYAVMKYACSNDPRLTKNYFPASKVITARLKPHTYSRNDERLISYDISSGLFERQSFVIIAWSTDVLKLLLLFENGVSVIVEMQGKFVTINDERHFQIVKQHLTLNMTSFKTYFYKLYNEDIEIGLIANEYINKNWKDVFAEIEPLVRETVNGVMKNLLDPLFLNYSWLQLFPN